MNSLVAFALGVAVVFAAYRLYAGWVDRRVIRPDPQRATPATMYMDGVDFIPTSKNVLFGYQFKSIAGAAPVVGAIMAAQWGWLPAPAVATRPREIARARVALWIAAAAVVGGGDRGAGAAGGGAVGR